MNNHNVEYLWFKGRVKFINGNDWFAEDFDCPVCVVLGYVSFIGGLSTKLEECTGTFTPIVSATEEVVYVEWQPVDYSEWQHMYHENPERYARINLLDTDTVLKVAEWSERIGESLPDKFALCERIERKNN